MLYLILSILLLLIIIDANTIKFVPKVSVVDEYEKVELASERIVESLSQAIQFETISKKESSNEDVKIFEAYLEFIKTRFSKVMSVSDLTMINDFSMILHIPGKSKELDPVLLTAHYDVVDAGTLEDWTHEPFDGTIDDEFIWGRGAIDDKVNQIALLHAIEHLIDQNQLPDYDLYLAFGHDEELGGGKGAKAMAEYFQENKINFRLVFDEGASISINSVPGITAPVALVGVGEKGYANIKLSYHSKGGHSATPPKHSGVYVIADAIKKVEDHPMKLRLIQPVSSLLKELGPHMHGIHKITLSNLWLFKKLFLKIFSKDAGCNGMLRTTIITTMVKGSDMMNVLPQNSTAALNARLLSGDTIESTLNHVKKVINNKTIDISLISGREATKISNDECEEFRTIKKTIQQLHPDSIIVPSIVLGGTDARHYEMVSNNIFRFSPFVLENSDYKRVHGIDERISIDNLMNSVSFYIQLLKNLS